MPSLGVWASASLLLATLVAAGPVPEPQGLGKLSNVVRAAGKKEKSKDKDKGKNMDDGSDATTTVQQRKQRTAMSGPQALAAAYSKHHGKMSRQQSNAATDTAQQGRVHSLVAANPEPYDAEYLSPITIGGQNLNVDFDTGSSDLWVFSSDLAASSQSGHDIYNPSKSSTAKKINGATWSIMYGDGSSANGDVYNDTVTVGTLSIKNQAVEAAQSVSGDFLSDTDNDGVFGLGFPIINTITPQQRTDFFFTAVQQGARGRTNVFTADLKKGVPGSYDFGFINTTKYTGAITYSPVDSSQGYWTFSPNGYAIGSGAFQSTTLTGIADTGTTLLLLPDAVVNAYWAKVSGAAYDDNYGAYTFPCLARLPSLTIGIGSTRFVLPGTYLNYAPVSSSTCYGGLQTSSGIGFNIYGDIFLKGFFVVFDASGPRIGIANKILP